MRSDTVPAPWYTNLLLVAGVILTVVMALLMSQLDRLQTRLVPTVAVMVQVTEPVATPTPLSAIALATAVPASPTPESAAAGATPENTATAAPVCRQTPEEWVPYVVQSGDTLFGLASRTGTTVDEIVRVNCLETQPLVTGMYIYLPMTPPPQVVCGPPDWWVRYTVQRGDTMFSLARSRGTTVTQVMNANCLVSTRLYAGRQIYLPPGGATAVPTATSTPQPLPTNTPRPTRTSAPPTSTPTAPPVPTMTPTWTPTAVTLTPTHTATVTATPVTPTVSATATATSVTPTFTPTGTATTAPTATATPLPPTSTYTATPVPPTNTATAVPPTNTFTPIPPTNTWTPTPQLPTATPTATPTP